MTDSTQRTTAIILAAGLGTRMKSRLPKALHRLGNQPMINHLITTAREVFDDIVVVTGPDMPALEEAVHPYRTVTQVERLGTAHAASTARELFGTGDVAILYADNPLITAETMKRLLAARQEGASLALLGMRPSEPGRYGRIVEEQGRVTKIVEFKDATEEERRIPLCNAGVMCAGAEDFRNWLANVHNDNAQGEYYLTDVVEMAAQNGAVICVEAAEAELAGVNSRAELAQAEATLQNRLRDAAMDAGVTLVAPETVFFSTDTLLEADVTIEPNVFFGPGVTVRTGALIRAFSHLEGCEVGEGAMIGPYARLRPGTLCGAHSHVGNFVELKNVELGEGAKANHLTYLGDASVGAATNVGAGTITCNYDGVFKHRTTIGERAFIGSDSILVAPVTIGDDALIAAGSVITQDVPAGDLAFGRAQQTLKTGRGIQIKQSLKARKEQG
ncbi:bifunctional UDP-N-acetylglucosamine diphosphorylase/glucosamine-1-phosphate N-acetyltransferase GlmU [Gluconobacter kanchanaburiensis]|uniref:Bifunctional protein GlmU n=1 Tax=Gluconobacter kanchanaburiensis NBRC 103587 TaxID=1307948 RepID=A0A511BDT3_9PROT|nr:bifunctional UDP-N-acetylglucosamine diphosphorylase/glucosamine-1-phosphate N-acetyltransferase GlmU [Gluconobacter kanchanaburiensis]MBF0861223.1 bifunctional UDP-N-acetylglucosamine diphosphorylase/glucosamine-1-phosphate N-acetyltransferase GlmU [Gluconobacter kanchanaburiensis]GBR70891.1 bifunctional N-acetylglucosamine-1-phosphate uridyltransferase [Gluconobacter kanchanaburiensis NBRC 103587]GEK95957.1 bifunctional protein GlmU [Gluconobacter kanchanaburiensis NBRC 103587]